MLDYKKMEAHGGKITGWGIMFQTPFGLCDTLEQAVERVEEVDMIPELVIKPVAVAITERSYEVVI